MNAFIPRDVNIALIVAGVLVSTLLTGYLASRLRQIVLARCLAWAIVIGSTVSVERLTADEPAGFRMTVICMALLFGMKGVVVVESKVALPLLRWFGFAATWLGMRPRIFADAQQKSLPGAWALVRKGTLRLSLGLGFILAARLVWLICQDRMPQLPARILATLVLLPGISLVLHFGLINLTAGAWRWLGVDCRPLFRAPLQARSLTDFWGRRWNLAFVEMTTIAFYRPVAGWLGRGPATFGSFFMSGLLHELAISVPAGGGYGLPTLYFMLHGGLVLAEQKLAWLPKFGLLAHVWTLGGLVLPLPILFHPWFLNSIVWPLIGMEATC